MNILSQIRVMVELQNDLQTKIDPEWKSKNYPWWRAAYMEGAEAVGQVGWKWWKHQVCDMPQVKLELVDIFHFLMNQIIEEEGVEEAIEFIHSKFISGNVLTPPQTVADNTEALIKHLEELTKSCLVNKRIWFYGFSECMRSANLTFNGLYLLYIGKNVLNVFRQEHGYKEGSYFKEWNGVEDNVVLMEILESEEIDLDNPEIFSDILLELEDRYSEVL